MEQLNYKLILLFVFDKMDIPITERTILDLCTVDNSWIPYMECKEVLHELIESGFVFVSNNNAGQLMSITPDGRVCLSHFYLRIPATLRDEIFEYTKNNRMRYRRKQEYFSDYFKNPDGTYTVCLKIISMTQNIMELKMIVQDRGKAKMIYKNWEDNAPNVFGNLYSMLVEGE